MEYLLIYFYVKTIMHTLVSEKIWANSIQIAPENRSRKKLLFFFYTHSGGFQIVYQPYIKKADRPTEPLSFRIDLGLDQNSIGITQNSNPIKPQISSARGQIGHV